MEICKTLTGILCIEFTAADPEKILHTIASAKIPIFHILRKQTLTCQIQIRRSDYRKLCKILQKQNANLRIIGKHGLFWSLIKFFRRPVLLSCILLVAFFSFYLPSRIFFITVEGNYTLEDSQILSAAEACGIQFGASRKLVRSEKVKNTLLSILPQLQWAGINTSGCTAVISVREREEEEPQKKNFVSNLIAAHDGYILAATVTGGTAHVQPGDSVTQGQILISGYTDCGLCIRASRAEGEVLAQTNRKLTAVMPENYTVPANTGNTHYQISLLIRKKRINLWKDSRISSTTCGRMYEEYYVSLPGGFQLPIALCIDRYLDYDLQKASIDETDAQLQLQKFSEDYLVKQMISGQIIQKQHKIMHSASLYRMDSNFICTELIGKERREQIGVMNG